MKEDWKIILAIIVLGVIPTVYLFVHSIYHPAPVQQCYNNPLLVCKGPNYHK